VLPAAPALFKPDGRFSRIRLYRIVSDAGMHRPATTPALGIWKRLRLLGPGPSPCLGSEHDSVVGYPKRYSLRLTVASIRQGSFAPRELLRFIATMAPSDSRPRLPTVIYSR
jgi:hypothetical protein